MIGNEKIWNPPAWHEAVPNDREATLDAGKITVSNWEKAKKKIKKNVS